MVSRSENIVNRWVRIKPQMIRLLYIMLAFFEYSSEAKALSTI